MTSGFSDMSEIRKNSQGQFSAYPKPPKIDLLQERPRRESLDHQLTTTIVRPSFSGQSTSQRSQYIQNNTQQVNRSQALDDILDEVERLQCTSRQTNNPTIRSQTVTTTSTYRSMGSNSVGPSSNNSALRQPTNYHRPKTPTNLSSTKTFEEPLLDVVHELTEKETNLRREIAYMNQYKNQWSLPRPTHKPRREPPPRQSRGRQSAWIKECPSGPTSRPTSRASSTRSTNTEADLMEKAAQLLEAAQELERQPLKQQAIVINHGKEPRPSPSPVPGLGDEHIALINVPDKEVDNKSPLPFSYDNFSTLGVRGNIASVGAAEPDSPYPPIFPVIKRTPSPTKRYW